MLNSDIREKKEISLLCEERQNMFLRIVKTDTGKGKPIIIFPPKVNIKKDGTSTSSRESNKLICKGKGILFNCVTVDCDSIYYNDHILPFGFTNIAICEGHLKKDGYRMMAEPLTEVTEEDQK